MFCLGHKLAKKHQEAFLVAKCLNNPKNDLYVVKEEMLPCDNGSAPENPLKLLSKKEIFQLRQKYRVSASLLKKIEECWMNNNKEMVLGDDCKTLGSRIFLEELGGNAPRGSHVNPFF